MPVNQFTQLLGFSHAVGCFVTVVQMLVLQVHFDRRCERVDFKSRTVDFTGLVVPYNLLVGADGARSSVRNEFITQRGFDYQQTNMPYTFKVLYVPRPPELSEEAVHAFR
jgi:kynurenine 3-monooxygenase